jgi:hypothetical protein
MPGKPWPVTTDTAGKSQPSGPWRETFYIFSYWKCHGQKIRHVTTDTAGNFQPVTADMAGKSWPETTDTARKSQQVTKWMPQQLLTK